MFFEENSLDKNITRALTSARGLRKVLREMEAAGPRKAKAVPAGRRSY
ncbi:hypothetical protein [Bradyrhizobium sp.]